MQRRKRQGKKKTSKDQASKQEKEKQDEELTYMQVYEVKQKIKNMMKLKTEKNGQRNGDNNRFGYDVRWWKKRYLKH